jgi:uncharacterized protein YcnI
MQLRWQVCVGSAAVLTLALAQAAQAHVYPNPTYVKTGATTDIEISFPNERRAPMTGFELRVPAGMRIEAATSEPGWTGAAKQRLATWTGGSIPALTTGDFSFRLETSRAPGNVTLEAVELYDDGGKVFWPVTLVVVPADEPSEQLGIALIVGLIGLLGLTIGGAFLWRRTGRSLQEK